MAGDDDQQQQNGRGEGEEEAEDKVGEENLQDDKSSSSSSDESDYDSDYSSDGYVGGGYESSDAEEDDNTPETNARKFTEALESRGNRKREDEEERDYVYHEDLFDFPRDPEKWREEDLRELWVDAPIEMTEPGWDPVWADEEEWEVVKNEVKEGRDPPIAPFYLPYRKPYPAIPDNHYDISNPRSVIEELDRIEEFLKWVSYVFPDGSSYEGTVWDDLAHGKGVYVAEEGLVRYEGEWLQNQMEGHGVVEVEIPGVEPVPGSKLEAKMRAEGRIISSDFMNPEDKKWLEMDIEDSILLAGNRREIPFYEKDEWIKVFGEKPEKGRYKYAGQWKHGRMHGCGVYEVNERIIYGRFYFGEHLEDSTGCDLDVSSLHAGIAEVAAAKARMFVNKPDGMVREERGPYGDPQHPYFYEEDDVWMAPGFINQFYEVPDYWKTYAEEVDQERELWLNSFYKAPLRIPMPAELEYWWSKGDDDPEFVLINKEPEPDPEDPSKLIYTEDPLIVHTRTGRLINYVDDEKYGIRLFWQPRLEDGEEVDPDKVEFLPVGYDEFFGRAQRVKKESKLMRLITKVENALKPFFDRLERWTEEKKKAIEMNQKLIEKELDFIEAEICLEEAMEDMENELKMKEKEEEGKREEETKRAREKEKSTSSSTTTIVLHKNEKKKNMRKDGGGGGGNNGNSAYPPLTISCYDLKTFIATLVVLTLFMAIWQLQPYESLLASNLSSSSSSSSCPLRLPNNITASTSTSNPLLPKQQKLSSIAAQNPTFTTPFDPNKRVFHPYGSAAALFVQMGAYRGGPYTFAVIGLASKPTHVFGKPWFKCEWVPNPNSSATNSSLPIRAKGYKMLPDWGYGRVYTVVVVNCTFPVVPNADNAGGKLNLYAYYSQSPRKYEKFVALEEAPGSYDESRFRPPYKYQYLYCGSSLYGNLSASRIREWMAYHAHFFGPNSHFVFHDAGGVSPAVRAVLEPWLRAGRATLQDIRGQAEYDGYYYNQFLVVNDCLHRYRHAANWTFFFDVDEYIYLPDGRTLELVLAELSPYTQFTIEQNPMSSKLCVLDSKGDYSKEWGFEKLVFRNSITGVRRDRKYAIQARNAYATGVHMSENVIGNTTHKTESLIRYYHYHNSINVLGEPCQEFVPIPPGGNATWFEKIPYVYDDNMKRMAETIKRFEEQTVGPIKV